MNEILVVIIPCVFTLVGVIINNCRNYRVIQVKLEELTREVREHNNFARRMPVVEAEIVHLKEDVKELKK